MVRAAPVLLACGAWLFVWGISGAQTPTGQIPSPQPTVNVVVTVNPTLAPPPDRGFHLDGQGIGLLVTGAIAIYGAALATAEYVMRRRGGRVELKVACKAAIKGWGPAPQELALVLEGRNTGGTSIAVKGYRLDLPNGESYLSGADSTSGIPGDLKPGRKVSVAFDFDGLRKHLKAKTALSGSIKVVGVFGDELDREWRSKPFTIDLG